MSGNPWVTTGRDATASAPLAPAQHGPTVDVAVEGPDWTGAQQPQAGVPVVDRADRLDQVQVTSAETLWVVGVHGGAGESTVAGWLARELDPQRPARATGHRWPVLRSGGRSEVVLVARTTSWALAAARRAATEWASGQTPVHVRALVLIPDAPGRLPAQLRDECKHLAGGVPHTWRMPYLPALRLDLAPGESHPPGPAHRIIRSITAHLQKEQK